MDNKRDEQPDSPKLDKQEGVTSWNQRKDEV